MIEQSSGRCYKYRATFPKSGLFSLNLLTTHDRGTGQVIKELLKAVKLVLNLDTEFSCGRENDGIGAFISRYLFCIQRVRRKVFDKRDQIS